MYFYGETIEKLGPRRYRLTRGGFTTCVQPTPRWEVTSGSVTLNLDDYAIARSTVLRVKGVPVMYLPGHVLPDQRGPARHRIPAADLRHVHGARAGDRATRSSGPSIAARTPRSFTTGSREPARAPAPSIATSRRRSPPETSGFYRFNQNETTFDGRWRDRRRCRPTTSYEIVGSLNHALTRNIRARARLDYFTDLVTQQLYHQNLYQASRNRRVIEAGLTAAFGTRVDQRAVPAQ